MLHLYSIFSGGATWYVSSYKIVTDCTLGHKYSVDLITFKHNGNNNSQESTEIELMYSQIVLGYIHEIMG